MSRRGEGQPSGRIIHCHTGTALESFRYMPTRSDRFRSHLPYGFDFESPETTKRRHSLEMRIRELFVEHGYLEVSPPLLDYARIFSLTVNAAQREERSFELYGSGGEHLAVRSDTTIQIVKAHAGRRLHSELPARYGYIEPVYFNRPWGSGYRREVRQAGVELLGEAEGRFLELLTLARRMAALVEQELLIVYSDAGFLEYLKGFVPEESRKELAVHFYNKDTHELARLARRHDLSESRTRILVEAPLVTGRGQAILQKLRELCKGEEVLLSILDRAEEYKDVIYDFSLVQGLSYYTGPVFDGYLPGNPAKLLGGGVYDRLFLEFTKEGQKACGFALNLDVLTRASESI